MTPPLSDPSLSTTTAEPLHLFPHPDQTDTPPPLPPYVGFISPSVKENILSLSTHQHLRPTPISTTTTTNPDQLPPALAASIQSAPTDRALSFNHPSSDPLSSIMGNDQRSSDPPAHVSYSPASEPSPSRSPTSHPFTDITSFSPNPIPVPKEVPFICPPSQIATEPIPQQVGLASSFSGLLTPKSGPIKIPPIMQHTHSIHPLRIPPLQRTSHDLLQSDQASVIFLRPSGPELDGKSDKSLDDLGSAIPALKISGPKSQSESNVSLQKSDQSASAPLSITQTSYPSLTSAAAVPTAEKSIDAIGIGSSPISLTQPSPSIPYLGRFGTNDEPSMSNLAKRPSMMTKRISRRIPEDEVLVGQPIKEGHRNFTLMYDMLTGIRISVSRCTGKPMRELITEDFTAAHKLAFDVTGNELTPSSRYDFKFKDYSPWVFRMIRECFHVDPAEYLLSLTGKYVLSELGSPGKSGSFFYFSSDYRFIIKTIHHSEHKFIRATLRKYFYHVCHNPHTLLSRIYGLHRVKLPGNRKIHFVVMGNVFPPNKDIHEVYDLKGSTFGRYADEETAKNSPHTVLKDLNWINRRRALHFGSEKAEFFLAQLQRDVSFLKAMEIMDYSLLVGIHDTITGNRDNIRDTTLSVFEPKPDTLLRQSSVLCNINSKAQAQAMRKVLESSVLVQLGPSNSQLPDDAPSERKYCVFYQDQGGFASTDKTNLPGKEIYYLGIIDIFTKYSVSKKIETFFKSIGHDKSKISSVNPIMYGDRFLEFIQAAIQKNFDPPPNVSDRSEGSFISPTTS